MTVRDPLPPAHPFLPLPIPGSGIPPRGLFVGRAGTLLPPHEKRAARFDPGEVGKRATELLFRACQLGWSVYLIGNEECVARGSMPDTAWETFEEKLLQFLRGQGIPVARNYACLDHPQGKGRHKRDSVFLFPNTGALYHARQEDGIELSESWVVSSNVLELVAGWRAGCQIAGVGRSSSRRDDGLQVEPAIQAEDLPQALAELMASDPMLRR